MRRVAVFFVPLLAITAISFAQTQPQANWIPQGIQTLQQSAVSKNDYAFDHSMLVLASKLDPNNQDLRRVIAGVSGVSVHRYRFADDWKIDDLALRSVGDEYRAAGWKQVLDKRGSGGDRAANIWVQMENNAVSHVAVMLARNNEVDFAVVSGSISPVDISHLGGHFGIPKVEGGVMVPNIEREP